jgi:hypothetical protein
MWLLTSRLWWSAKSTDFAVRPRKKRPAMPAFFVGAG